MASLIVRANQPQSLTRVARGVVRRRLLAVGRAAAAASGAKAGVAAVHRLRVATRRATAAITVFRPLIPRRQRRWIRKALRWIRRAAGEARDLDVLVAHGREAAPGLAKLLADRRLETRRRLRAGLAELPMHAWDREAAVTVAAVDAGSTVETVASFARRRARRLVRRSLTRLDRRLHGGRAIHRLRIETKKLRYVLEVIAELAPGVPSASDRPLHRLQDRLGTYTDHATAANRLGRWARREKDGCDRRTLLAACGCESHAAKQTRRACERWWTRPRRTRVVRMLERMLGDLAE